LTVSPAITRWACLEFTNTTAWRGAPEPVEKLRRYEELVDWSTAVRLIPESTAQELRRQAREQPKQAARALGRARELRECLYRMFVAIVDGAQPVGPDVALFDAALATAFSRPRLVGGAGTFHLEWSGSGSELDLVVHAVVRSASELLTSPQLERVRYCADDLCGWLFLDVSRNGTRRWCLMSDCGNRAKVRRFRERQRRRRK
jgi:predicted RNA-binding Zn ribbon-like protein